MTLKQLVPVLVAATPVTFLGWVGFESRIYEDAFETKPVNQVEEERTLAYGEPVRLFRDAQNLGPADRNAESYRKVAVVWLAMFEDGKLQSLPLYDYEYSCREGTKQQIDLAAQSLARSLEIIGDAEQRNGNTKMAAKDYMDAFRIGEILKYSDITSYLDCTSRQTAVVNKLIQVRDHLSNDDLEYVRFSVLDQDCVRRLGTLVDHERMALMRSPRELTNELPIDHASVDQTVRFIRTSHTGNRSVEQLQAMTTGSRNGATQILMNARQAYGRATRLEQATKDLLGIEVAVADRMPEIEVIDTEQLPQSTPVDHQDMRGRYPDGPHAWRMRPVSDQESP